MPRKRWARDRTAIGIDDDVFRSRENRYRFSLAHELGHVVLRDEVYRAGGWNDVTTWKRQIREFPPDVYKRMEWQANEFAGALLMPRAVASTEIETCRRSIAAVAPTLEQDDPAQHEAYVAECLASRFCVSPQSARIRLGRLRQP